MKTTEWNYDFSSLPCWSNRETDPYIFDEYFALSKTDTLCCIYSITEATMCNYLGFLAILKGKDKPTLYLNIASRFNFCDEFFCSDNENLIFLQPSLYNVNYGSKRPILVIDIISNRFSYLFRDNVRSTFKIVQKSDCRFKFVPNEKTDKQEKTTINIINLIWHDIQKLNSLPEMLYNE